MNKSAIQRFAIWARTELITQVSQRAYQYGITKDGYGEAYAVTVAGRALSSDEQRQRKELVEQIRRKGYTQVMEEVAYTWFNRFIALRFMEVNNYLPSHIRVFSDSPGAFKPEILNDVLHLDLPGLDKEKVAEYIENNQTEALYRYLLLTQCNALNQFLPRMFERMGGFTELLLPNNILKQDSVLGHMVTDIPEEDWTDQVQIIGWLYQYYNTELKDDTFALLKKNVKITKERIPSATQLFTPDWIVRYMVENSLGRLWIEGHPNDELKAGWKYYLDEAEQEADVQAQLEAIRAEYRSMKPQDIKVIDPCMGSGHILVYAFDVLVQIYKTYGISERDAAQSILENNLYGLDIDDRAAQLAYFAVMMKARQYDRRIFSRGIQPHVYSIVESNGLDANAVEYFANNDPKLKKDFGTLVDELRDAKEYGSILNVSQVDFSALYARIEEARDDISIFREIVLNSILPLIQVAEVLAQKYHVVVTNPPYMGGSGMGAKLADFVKKNYPDSKSDLFACFMERADSLVMPKGYTSLITMESWMFLSSFEKMRSIVNNTKTIINMVHMPYLGKGGTSLGINFGTAAVIMMKGRIPKYTGQYEYTVYYECDENGVPFQFPTINERWKTAQQDNFSKIPGSPVAYWLGKSSYAAFTQGKVGDTCISKCGMGTSNNNLFLRMWYEVNMNNIGYHYTNIEETKDCKYRWMPYDKGGEYRKWYGNRFYVVNFYNNGADIRWATRDATGGRVVGTDYYFKEHISWSDITSGENGYRWFDSGFIFDACANAAFYNDEEEMYYGLGYYNSSPVAAWSKILNPTFHFKISNFQGLPFVKSRVEEVVFRTKQNISLSRKDWDSYETSWDFQQHPLVPDVDVADISENALEFSVFCVESVAERLGVSGEAVYQAFTEKSDLLDGYILPLYEPLHTQGKDYIVDILLETMAERGVEV